MFFLATCGGQIAITSDEIRYCAGGFGIAITLASILVSWQKRSFTWAPLYGSLLLLHPAWWMSLDAGDCGLAMRFLSVCASLTLAAILSCQIFWPHLGRRRFILSLCLVSWAVYLLGWPTDVILSHFWQPDPGGGFAEQTVVSFIAADSNLRLLALALTFVSLVLGLFNRTRRGRSAKGTPTPRRSQQTASQVVCNSELKTHWRSISPLRILASALLLTLIALYVSSSFIAFPPSLAPLFALVWSVVLVIITVRGRFPGWEESEPKRTGSLTVS